MNLTPKAVYVLGKIRAYYNQERKLDFPDESVFMPAPYHELVELAQNGLIVYDSEKSVVGRYIRLPDKFVEMYASDSAPE